MSHILTIFVIVAVILGVDSYPALSEDQGSTNSSNFDVLIFTQSWLPTVCYKVRKTNQTIKCNEPNNNDWIIHGIWPMILHTITPLYCNKSLKFDSTALEPIEKEMRVKWMIADSQGEPMGFWQHEWDKHGTCSISLERLKNQRQYFQTGLELFDQYNIRKILNEAQIFIGYSYSIDNILQRLTKVLGKRAMVACIYNSEKKESYFFEVRICFDKSFNLIDCDGIHAFPTNCMKNKKVIYPDVAPK